ncbi:MAG: class I SAM-dependent methyltransferase [Proteobacteria bacterium]|nr:class I SAM-dependent methyltransferase [Pseudomonadota bacterium]
MSTHTDWELVDLQETLYTSRNPTRRWLHCSRRDWIVDHVQAVAGPLPRVLEVGPGAGGYLPVLAGVSSEVVAADIEEAYLSQARILTESIPGLTCVKDDITATALRTDSFNLILCTEVIEHIVDSDAALCGLRKILAPGGTLILSTPQRYSPLELCAKIAFLPGIIHLVRLVYREPIIETGHINLLTEKTLKVQIEAAGLQIQEEYKSGFYLPLIAEFFGNKGLVLLQWCEKKLRGSRLSGLLWTQYYILTK